MDIPVMFAVGRCFVCRRLFPFDPDRVPSVPIDPETQLPPDLGGDPERATREPICRDCVERANANRSQTGHEQIYVLPGAYPFDEEEAP